MSSPYVLEYDGAPWFVHPIEGGAVIERIYGYRAAHWRKVTEFYLVSDEHEWSIKAGKIRMPLAKDLSAELEKIYADWSSS